MICSRLNDYEEYTAFNLSQRSGLNEKFNWIT